MTFDQLMAEFRRLGNAWLAEQGFTCDVAPDPRRHGTRITGQCTQPAGHTGCHTSRASDGCLTGWTH